MSLRKLIRLQLIQELVIISFVATTQDARLQLLAGLTIMAMLVAHRRELISAVAAATLDVVSSRCEATSEPGIGELEAGRSPQK